MRTRSETKHQGGLPFYFAVVKPAEKRAKGGREPEIPHKRHKHRRHKREKDQHLQKAMEDVDIESQPMESDGTVSPWSAASGDVSSPNAGSGGNVDVMDIPNAVADQDSVSENLSELIADIDKEMKSDNTTGGVRNGSCKSRLGLTNDSGDACVADNKSNNAIEHGDTDSLQDIVVPDISRDKHSKLPNGVDNQNSAEQKADDKSPTNHWKSKIKLSTLRESSSLIAIPEPTRKDSLTVPDMTSQTLITSEATATSLKHDRRDSTVSRLSSLISPRSVDGRNVDYSVVYMPPEEKKPSVYSVEDSWIRQAIPFLPLWVAVICLVMNILLPGSGTCSLFYRGYTHYIMAFVLCGLGYACYLKISSSFTTSKTLKSLS